MPPGAVRRLGTVTLLPARAVGESDHDAEGRRLREEDRRSIRWLCLSDAGKRVITRRGDGTVQVWQLPTGKLLHQWCLDGEPPLAFSPDGELVAVVGKNNTIVLLAGDTGKQVRRFREPLPSDVSFVFFSADARALIGRHFYPPRISRWDVASGRMLECAGYDVDMNEVSWTSPDGKVLALGSPEGSVSIWDQQTQKLRCRRDGYGMVMDLAFSPDGSRLASLCGERTIWIWDTKTYQPVRRLSWRGPRGWFAVFSPDGKLLACNAGQEVILWEVATGKVRGTFSGHQGDATVAAFTPDGKQMLTGSRDGTVLVWDLAAPLPAPSAARVRRDRYGDPLPAAAWARLGCARLYAEGLSLDSREGFLAFSADGKRLFVGVPRPGEYLAEEGPRQDLLDLHPSENSPGLCVLEAPGGKESLRLQDAPEAIDCLALSADGKSLAALLTPTLYLWDAQTGKMKWMAHDELPHPKEQFFPVHRLTFSPDGRLLAAASEEQIELVDADTGRRIHELRGCPPGVAALAFTRDGKQLLSCSGPRRRMNEKKEEVIDPGTVVSWDRRTGRQVRSLALPADLDLGSFCLSADGSLLAACQGDQRVRLWDIAGGRELPSVPCAGMALAFSPDGKRLAIGGQKLRLWEIAARKEVLSLPSVELYTWAIRFSSDGKLLVARGATQLHFWDLARGREIVPYEGHRSAINALACATRGKLLLSGGADRTLRLSDTAAGRVLRELHGHEDTVLAVALSPDGALAASLDFAGQALLWDTATGRRLRQARVAAPPPANVLIGATTKLAFRDDGKTLFIADAGGGARLWQVSPWKEVRSFRGDGEPAWPPALSPDGKLLALPGNFAGKRTWARVVETGTGAERWRITDREDRKQCEAALFSPDGGFLAVSRSSVLPTGPTLDRGQLSFHEATTGKEMLALDTSSPVAGMAFSPDGKRLATTGRRGDPPSLWDVRTGKLLGEAAGHRSAATTLVFSADGRTLFSAGFDGAILAWDVDRLAQEQPSRPHDLTASQMQQAWDDLSGADAARAFRAIAELSALPAKTVPFLQARLRPATVEDPGRITRLIADLDSEDFTVREQATRLLTEKVDQAESALRQALQRQPALETRRRLEGILVHLQTSPEQRRAWRVCLLLDWLDTPEADKLLRTLADGAADARLTREARAALERRGRRQAP